MSNTVISRMTNGTVKIITNGTPKYYINSNSIIVKPFENGTTALVVTDNEKIEIILRLVDITSINGVAYVQGTSLEATMDTIADGVFYH